MPDRLYTGPSGSHGGFRMPRGDHGEDTVAHPTSATAGQPSSRPVASTPIQVYTSFDYTATRFPRTCHSGRGATPSDPAIESLPNGTPARSSPSAFGDFNTVAPNWATPGRPVWATYVFSAHESRTTAPLLTKEGLGKVTGSPSTPLNPPFVSGDLNTYWATAATWREPPQGAASSRGGG